MAKEKNKQIVQDLREKLSRAKSIVFTDYLGLTATEVSNLRAKLKENDAEMVVAKNTLVKVALKEELNSEEANEALEGPTATIISFSDPITPIKDILEYAQDRELPKVKSGYIEGIYNSANQVNALKDIPSKEILISKLVGSLKSPLSGIAGVLGGVQRKFVYAVDAIAKQKTE